MTIVIALVSQKGGIFKSTLSRSLGTEAVRAGLRTKIADLDNQQGTSIDWHRRRLAAGIEPSISVEAFATAAQALKVADQYDLLILDGPARTSQGTLEIAKVATLVVQPSGPSLDDLLPTIRAFHALVQAGVPTTRLTVALTRVGTDAEEIEARQYVADAGYNVLDGFLPERPAYRKAQNLGYSVTETAYPSLNAKAEGVIQAIIDRASSNG